MHSEYRAFRPELFEVLRGQPGQNLDHPSGGTISGSGSGRWADGLK
jgi:hypothetical protein